MALPVESQITLILIRLRSITKSLNGIQDQVDRIQEMLEIVEYSDDDEDEE